MKKRSFVIPVLTITLVVVVSLILIPKYRIGGSLYTVKSEDLKTNFENNAQEFYELKDFIDSLYPENGFYLGYDESNRRYELGLSRLEWSDYNTASKSEVYFYRAKGLKINSGDLSMALDSINIDEKQFHLIIEKFEATNCTFFSKSIHKYKPFYLKYGYDNSWLLSACFSYSIFDRDVSDTIKNNWGLREGVVKHNEIVYFEYGYPL